MPQARSAWSMLCLWLSPQPKRVPAVQCRTPGGLPRHPARRKHRHPACSYLARSDLAPPSPSPHRCAQMLASLSRQLSGPPAPQLSQRAQTWILRGQRLLGWSRVRLARVLLLSCMRQRALPVVRRAAAQQGLQTAIAVASQKREEGKPENGLSSSQRGMEQLRTAPDVLDTVNIPAGSPDGRKGGKRIHWHHCSHDDVDSGKLCRTLFGCAGDIAVICLQSGKVHHEYEARAQ